MLAYVKRQDNTFGLEQRPKPRLDQDHVAVIRVISCSICGTDVRAYRFGSDKIGPGRIVGHEVTGEIIEISDDFKNVFSVGDQVAVAPAIGCGHCSYCMSGKTNMCDTLETIGFEYDGGFAEYMAIPRQAMLMDNVYRLPQDDNYAKYSLCEPLACTINAHTYLKIQESDSVVIFGSGIIGCLHAELALLAGAKNIIIVEPSEDRLKQAQDLLPQVSFINSSETDVETELFGITDNHGADVAVIACSVGSAQAQAMGLLAKCGRISLFGGLVGESNGFIDSNIVHYREISVYGVHASTPAQNKQAMKLLKEGKIDLEKYITRRFPLSEIDLAFQEASSGKAMKIVIENNNTDKGDNRG